MRTRTRYVAMQSVAEGMELAEPAKDRFQRTLLPAHAQLTEENLHQLEAHHVEFVCILEEDKRTAEQIAVDTAATAHRVLKIFEQADLGEPCMAALFNQILMYRSA